MCVQIGQCGNQVGFSLFSAIMREICAANASKNKNNRIFCEEAIDSFFRQSKREKEIPTARACLIDTEPKVIQSAIVDAKYNNVHTSLYET